MKVAIASKVKNGTEFVKRYGKKAISEPSIFNKAMYMDWPKTLLRQRNIDINNNDVRQFEI